MTKKLTIRAFAIALALAFSAGFAAATPLSEAVRAAVTTNPTARAADANVRASAFELLQLQGEYQPSLSLFADGGASYFDDSDRLTPEDQRDTKFAREAGVLGELILFDGYRRANTVYRNAARLDGSIFRLLDASETIGLSAVEAYTDVDRHRKLLVVAQDNIDNHIDIIEQLEDLVAAGRLPASAGFEAQERLLAARLAKLEVERALANANAKYLAIIGSDPGRNLQIPFVRNLPLNKRDFVLASVRNSFRVKQFETVIAQRTFQLGIDTSDQRPQVKLGAGYRYGRDVSGTSGSEADAFVGLRAEWNFFAGGRQARLRALQYRTNEAIAERDAVRRDVFELAERAWHAYDTNIERTVLLGRRLTAAFETREEFKKQFQAGSRTLLDLLNSERTYFTVRFEKVSADASFVFSQYRLLASQSMLAKYFGVKAAEVALDPTFTERATEASQPTAIFRTEIRSLE